MLSFVSFLDFIYKGGKHLIYKAHKFSLATEKLPQSPRARRDAALQIREGLRNPRGVVDCSVGQALAEQA